MEHGSKVETDGFDALWRSQLFRLVYQSNIFAHHRRIFSRNLFSIRFSRKNVFAGLVETVRVGSSDGRNMGVTIEPVDNNDGVLV